MSEKKDVQARIQSIEGLVHEIEKLPDPATRSICQQLVQSLMDLHGSGFERMLEIVHRSGESGQAVIDEMSRDELVRSLLLLYGLHPLDMQARVADALEKSRPLAGAPVAKVDLIGISEAGVVTLRFEKSGHGCQSTVASLKSSIEQAIYDAAPEVTSVIIEGGDDSAISGAFVSVESLQASVGAR